MDAPLPPDPDGPETGVPGMPDEGPETGVPGGKGPAPDDKKEDGWHWHLNTGATFNLSDNRSVVGQLGAEM